MRQQPRGRIACQVLAGKHARARVARVRLRAVRLYRHGKPPRLRLVCQFRYHGQIYTIMSVNPGAAVGSRLPSRVSAGSALPSASRCASTPDSRHSRATA